MPKVLLLPDGFPIDSSKPIKDDYDNFEDFRTQHIKVDFKGVEHMKEVYISRDTLLNFLKDETLAGIVFYSAKIKLEYPKDSGKISDQITMSAVGVDQSGHLRNDGEGAFYISRPCPKYCPEWG